MVDGIDRERRHEIDYSLSPDEIVMIDDPLLPESLRAMRPPAWFRPEGSQAQHTVG